MGDRNQPQFDPQFSNDIFRVVLPFLNARALSGMNFELKYYKDGFEILVHHANQKYALYSLHVDTVQNQYTLFRYDNAPKSNAVSASKTFRLSQHENPVTFISNLITTDLHNFQPFTLRSDPSTQPQLAISVPQTAPSPQIYHSLTFDDPYFVEQMHNYHVLFKHIDQAMENLVNFYVKNPKLRPQIIQNLEMACMTLKSSVTA